ncbi:class I lanthipeptide [Chitinophaga nivalis]|uniref:class I lanthipeptide n=1 Tax=Chitinophaga nivalis TaxID=2991709 RepID=UPI00353150D0
MKKTSLQLDRKLFLQRETVAVLESNPQRSIAEGPQAISAPFETAFSMKSPAKCLPCCKMPITMGGECSN